MKRIAVLLSLVAHHFIYLRGAAERSEVGLIEGVQGAEERFGDLMAQ